jgi:vacuolar-type H+-ATPase subunit I/STV1
MEKLCSCCRAAVDSEDAAILTLGGFGNAKYLCDECDGYLNTVTRGRHAYEIDGAADSLRERIRKAGIDDPLTLKTVESVLKEAKERRDSIERGEYDFAVEEEEDEKSEDIPEELRETEEDRIADEKEAAVNKKWDKIITIVAAVVFIAVVGFLAYKFIAAYFL